MKIKPNKLRRHILDMVYRAKSGHIGGSFSICEIVACLYSVYPDLIEENKDKLILSKGHAVPALYAVFYELGLIDSLNSFRRIDSPLQGHPDHEKLKYLHATTGSLGQGLSIAIGHAMAYKMKGESYRVFCIVGDGEMQEGQIWEALMLAPLYKLDNLVCFLDMNGYQNDGETVFSLGEIETQLTVFGWDVCNIDGHNEADIESAIRRKMVDAPLFVIADTVKGKGVSFMENSEWHAKAPNKKEYEAAIKELL